MNVQFFQDHLMKRLFFSIELPLIFYWKSIDCIFVGLSLSTLLSSAHLYVYSLVNITLFWWLYLHRSLEFREYVSFNFVLFHNCLWKFIFLCKFKNHVVDIYRITCNRCPVKECWSYMFLLRCMLREWCVRVIWEWGFWSYDVKRSSIRYFH